MQQKQKELIRVKATALAISVEDAKTIQQFRKTSAIKYPILSDSSHEVSDKFQTYSARDKFSVPALFLIDTKGVIRVGKVGVPHGPFDPSAIDQSIKWIKKNEPKKSGAGA